MLISLWIPDAFNNVRLCLLLATEDSNFICVFEKQMFMLPTMVTMSISATRMYRDLADYFLNTDVCAILRSIIPRTHYGRRHNSIVSSDGTQRRRYPESHANSAINTHNRLEVAVHTTYDQYLGSPEDKDIPFVRMDGRLRDKPLRMSLHEGIGSDV